MVAVTVVYAALTVVACIGCGSDCSCVALTSTCPVTLYGNVMGTPIINQPQVAILALGAIRKKPAVIETPEGDVIGIRQMMFLSHSYDHRVVDGMLGGSFVRRVADYLEAFDLDRPIV